MERKEQVQLGVIGLGLILIVFFVWMNAKGARKKKTAPAHAPENATAVEPSVTAAQNATLRDNISDMQEKRWEAAWGRDPFRVSSDTAGRLVELELKGISFSQDKKGFAFINDQIVTAGDVLSGYTVSRIEKDRVVLARGAQTFILTFLENQ